MNFVSINNITVGTHLVLYKTQGDLLVDFGKGRGGKKTEILLLTVTSFSELDFRAKDRFEVEYFFSQRTGERWEGDVAQVATEEQVTMIRAIQAYNKEVAAIRRALDVPGEPWDAVIELFRNQPSLLHGKTIWEY